MPTRATGRYERTTVGGEEVAAFVPHALPPADPAEPPMTPGERGDRMMRQRAQTGIPLPPPVAADLRALAGRLAIPLPAALGT